jgi:sarcosine oxidase delta subunit
MPEVSGEMIGESAVQCPYCGEQVYLELDAYGAHQEQYTEDCSVCCRPWVVSVTRDGEEVSVSLAREDD